MSLKSEIRIGKSRFLNSYSVSYKAYGNLMGILLPDVVDTFLQTSLVDLLTKSESSIDIKGATTGNNSQQAKDEILKLHGKVVLPGDLHVGSKNYQRESFSASLCSSFKEFRKGKHIEFNIEEGRTGPLPKAISLNTLGRIVPLETEIVTATLEFIKPKRVFGIGMSPTLLSVFRLTATKERLGVEVDIINSPNLDLMPLTLHEFMQELSDKFEPSISFNIFKDFYSKLEAPTS